MHLTRRKHLNTLHSETIPSMFHLVAKRIACCRLDARISAIKQAPESVRNRMGILGYISTEELRAYLFQRQHHTNIRMKRRKDDIPTIQIIIHHFQYYHQSDVFGGRLRVSTHQLSSTFTKSISSCSHSSIIGYLHSILNPTFTGTRFRTCSNVVNGP